MPTTTASWRPSTYLKSDGKSASIGNSVDPGLPKMVVIPRARNSSNAASRIVVAERRDFAGCSSFGFASFPVRVAACAIGLPPLLDRAEARSLLRELEDRIEIEIAVIGA